MHELKVPDRIVSDPDAREILRVWTNGDAQGFAATPDAWSDPAGWGLLFVDLARHVAQGYCRKHGGDPDEVLARIRAGLDAEWAHPTDP